MQHSTGLNARKTGPPGKNSQRLSARRVRLSRPTRGRGVDPAWTSLGIVAVVFLVTAVALSAGWAESSMWGSFTAWFDTDEYDGAPTAWAEVVVAPGDSLWTFARRFVDEQGDPRALVDAIREANQDDLGNLHPGQIVRIPLSADTGDVHTHADRRLAVVEVGHP